MNVTRRVCLKLGASLVALPVLGAAADPQGATVFAAASLTDVLTAIIADYAKISPIRVQASFAASSALARQIESGAPADIFLSADRDWMDDLQSHGLIRPESRQDLLGNRLVLVAPQASSLKLKIGTGPAIGDALGDAHWVTGDPDSVPVGRYAMAALQKLGAWDGIAAKLVRADNVRAALALVARGEVTFGIVYATDAQAEPKVRIVDEFPADSHPPIVYPVALLRTATHGAASFLHYLRTPPASAVFRRYGFQTMYP